MDLTVRGFLSESLDDDWMGVAEERGQWKPEDAPRVVVTTAMKLNPAQFQGRHNLSPEIPSEFL